MFKKESFADEIARGMAQNLIRSNLDRTHNLDKLTQAVDYLQAAAELFDNSGFSAEAEEITSMLEKLADKKKDLNK